MAGCSPGKRKERWGARQLRQAKGYCTSRGWEIVADYVEPGVSATDDRRPEFPAHGRRGHDQAAEFLAPSSRNPRRSRQ